MTTMESFGLTLNQNDCQFKAMPAPPLTYEPGGEVSCLFYVANSTSFHLQQKRQWFGELRQDSQGLPLSKKWCANAGVTTNLFWKYRMDLRGPNIAHRQEQQLYHSSPLEVAELCNKLNNTKANHHSRLKTLLKPITMLLETSHLKEFDRGLRKDMLLTHGVEHYIRTIPKLKGPSTAWICAESRKKWFATHSYNGERDASIFGTPDLDITRFLYTDSHRDGEHSSRHCEFSPSKLPEFLSFLVSEREDGTDPGGYIYIVCG